MFCSFFLLPIVLKMCSVVYNHVHLFPKFNLLSLAILPTVRIVYKSFSELLSQYRIRQEVDFKRAEEHHVFGQFLCGLG